LADSTDVSNAVIEQFAIMILTVENKMNWN